MLRLLSFVALLASTISIDNSKSNKGQPGPSRAFRATSTSSQVASVFSTGNGQFRVESGKSAGEGHQLAYGEYISGNSLDGWNSLDLFATQIPTSGDDMVETRRALGFLEAQLTCRDMLLFFPNFYNDLLGDEEPGDEVLLFLREQHDWMISMAEKSWQEDEYWLAQRALLAQLEGMYSGFLQSDCLKQQQQQDSQAFSWKSLAVSPRLEQFLLINAWGDMYQIGLKFKLPESRAYSRMYGVQRHRERRVERCSALVKLLPDGSDVLFGHNTWDGYQGMAPRIFKHYSFSLFRGNDVPAQPYDVQFSSSPLLLSSVDDFFVLDGAANLGVIETTNSLFNVRLLDLVVPQSALSWQRAQVANVVAASGAAWPELFARYHSGTYTNQWIVLDLALFSPGVAPSAGFLSVLEEVPGKVVWADQTATLVRQGFWSSYNNPFYSEIRELSGYTALCRGGASEACYDQSPRAVLFVQYQDSVTVMAGMQAIMQYNNYTLDAASAGDACAAIACRGDLPEPLEGGPFGALDAKISSARLARRAPSSAGQQPYAPRIYAHLGPTMSGGTLPPFCWSASYPEGASEIRYSHQGHPDCFDFGWHTFGPDEDGR